MNNNKLTKRFINLNEPTKNTKLNVGFLKELIGSNNIINKNLYPNNVTKFEPIFDFVITCGDLPRFDDHGTWRRISTIPFVKKI